MIARTISWIKSFTLRQGGLALNSRRENSHPGVTGLIIPGLHRLGEINLARQYAFWLAEIQAKDGAFTDAYAAFNNSYDLGCVLRGWLFARQDYPDLDKPMRALCAWILAHADKVTGQLWMEPASPDLTFGPRGPAVEAMHLCCLQPLRNAGEALGDPRVIDLVERAAARYAEPECINQLTQSGAATCHKAAVQLALMDLGCVEEASRGPAWLDAPQPDPGFLPGRADAPWVCSAGLSLLMQARRRLGQAERASRIRGVLQQLQNPSGGFYGSYGVAAPEDSAYESPVPAGHFLQAEADGHAAGTCSVAGLTPRAEPRRVLLVVCLYERNFGDMLIYRTVEDWLRQRGLATETVEISQPVSASGFLKRANEADFVLFVGGGVIERWAPEIITRFPEIVPQLRSPYGVVGLSTGEFDYSGMAQALRLFCDRADFFYTRDDESIETFRRAGAKRLPHAGPDVVFAHPAIQPPGTVGTQIHASFRNVPYADVTGDLDWPRWAEALREIGVASLISDCSPAQDRLGLPVGREGVLQTIAASSIIVAMRYHVIVTAAMMGIPSIPIAYCPKVARLARQLGLAEYGLGIHEPGRLAATAKRLREHLPEVRQQLAQRTGGLRERARNMLETAARHIQKRNPSHAC